MKSTVKCSLCRAAFPSKPALIKHLEHIHDVQKKHSKAEFDSMAQFRDWKIKMERDTKSLYTLSSGSKMQSNKLVRKAVYVCNRSGHYAPSRKGEKKRELKVRGSIKIGSTCPAHMIVVTKQNDAGKVYVTFYSTHVGHEAEVGMLRLTNSEKQSLAAQLLQGVPKKVILQKVALNFSPTKRLSHSTIKDLHNISQAYNLQSDSKFHDDDAASVDIWVRKMREETDNPVLFYKPQGVLSPDYPEMAEHDFQLALMNGAQQELFAMYGSNIVMIDSTHGTNPYNIKLTTIMVVDSNFEGFPVAFLFSISETESTFKQFFRAISERLPKIAPKSFMSDDAPALYNAWSQVFPEIPRKILCTWHVIKNLNQNLSKIGDVVKRQAARAKIDMLVHELDLVTFERLLESTVDDLLADEDTVNYGRYFVNHYSHRAAQWALTHRKDVRRNTNMALERWHMEIKHNASIGGRCQQRLDCSIQNVMQCLHDKCMNRLVSLSRGKLPRKLSDLRQRHKASLSLCDEGVVVINDGSKWVVPSSRNQQCSVIEMYEVILDNPSCTCAIRCSDCNACIHAFQCQCHDYAIGVQMCKHIHQICRLYPRFVPEMAGTSDIADTHHECIQDAGNLLIDVTDCQISVEREHDVISNYLQRHKSRDLLSQKKLSVIDNLKRLISVAENCNSSCVLDVIARNLAPIDPALESFESSSVTSIIRTCPKAPHNKREKQQRRLQPLMKKRKQRNCSKYSHVNDDELALTLLLNTVTSEPSITKPNLVRLGATTARSSDVMGCRTTVRKVISTATHSLAHCTRPAIVVQQHVQLEPSITSSVSYGATPPGKFDKGITVGFRKDIPQNNHKLFVHRTLEERNLFALKCLMKQPYDAEEVIEGNYVINEMQIYRKHEQISNCIVNDNISINSLQNYFSRTGWEFLCQIMREKRANLKWLCEICSEQIGKGNRIVCDVCLTWYHMPCLNID